MAIDFPLAKDMLEFKNKKDMKKKITNFFFSKFAWIVAIAVYSLSIIVSFVMEHYVGGADIGSTLFLRITTIVLDVAFIASGFYALTKRWLKKRFLRREIFRRNLFWVLYLAETMAIFLLFYIPYVVRVLYLFLEDKISLQTLIINLTIGIVAVIVLGYFIKKIIKRLKKMGKRIQDNYNGKNGKH